MIPSPEVLRELTGWIRLVPLIWVLVSSYRHNDRMGMAIGILYSVAIFVSSIVQWEYGFILSVPLVFLVSWYILKSHRS